MEKPNSSIDSIWKWFTVLLLLFFGGGLFVNLDNTAFWEDEGETVQLAKSILKFGYPSVFDGRSFFIQEADRVDPKSFARWTSPYLQFYMAAIPLFFSGGIADTGFMRLPFALIAFSGILASVMIFRKLHFSPFSLFLYSLQLSSSIQLFLYYRQVRHYALQFPLALLVVWTFLNFEKLKMKTIFIVSSIFLYHAFYPAFFVIFIGLMLQRVIEKLLMRRPMLPFISALVPIALLTLPAFLYLRQYQQIPGNAYLRNVMAYVYDLNYFAYLKITAGAVLVMGFLTWKRHRKSMSRAAVFSLWRKNRIIPLICFFLITAVLSFSFGRHNARYLSVFLPFSFLLLGWSWDRLILLQSSHQSQFFYRCVSIPIFVVLLMWSHPKFFNEIILFTKELRGTYVGPIEVIVNTINSRPIGRIDEWTAWQPHLLIATNFEEHALFSYLNSQFLNIQAKGVYKDGDRPPDWIIPRAHWNEEDYFQELFSQADYERIGTPYCDQPYEQTYLVRTHHFDNKKNCERKITLYRLQNLDRE